MKTTNFKRLAMLGCIVYACALNAQTNEVATPLFSADVKDVVSMYCDENAEIFYLHTLISKYSGMRYTVSREGVILSEEPGMPMWICMEDGVKYTHTLSEDCILNPKGDAVLSYKLLKSAQSMFRKDGVFYWWFGPAKIVNALASYVYAYKEGDEQPIYIRNVRFHCTGLIVMDDKVLCTGVKLSTMEGRYALYNNDDSSDWNYQEIKELPGLKHPVGLSLVDDTFYIWSDDTQTMYTVPKSFFSTADNTTGVQASIVGDNEQTETYTLDGRPADGTQKGILIRNGKKVIVK